MDASPRHTQKTPNPSPHTRSTRPRHSAVHDPWLRAHLGGCRHVFLDVGSNIGQQTQLLFNGSSGGGNKLARLFDQYFGPQEERRRTVCAVGIEVRRT